MEASSIRNKHSAFHSILTVFVLIYFFLTPGTLSPEMPDPLSGVYLPPQTFTGKRFLEISHYYKLSGMNAVVLHVKDPLGRIYWKSKNKLAIDIGAVSSNGSTERAVTFFKQKKIWTIAKVDVFQDRALAREKPGYAVLHSETGMPWSDFNGLNWTNPYNQKVWDYIISLCQELVDMGFDEIQFDYVRFPSDGKLKYMKYPDKIPDLSMAECIGRFLEKAYSELKKTGVMISVDLFGLTAWKRDDFGVGQVLEPISPHTDVICPMFYPSHFPKGFLGLETPSDHPKKIMSLSTKMLKERTSKKIRPWVQGFWYTPEEISRQLDGLTGSGTSGWMAWNSSGNYTETYLALSKRLSVVFPEPVFYPTIDELKHVSPEKTVQGNTRVINYTLYNKGYSILSLEPPVAGSMKNYSTPVSVVLTLDEAILDIILVKNRYQFGSRRGKYSKSIQVAEIMCQQLGVDAKQFRPGSVIVDWGNTGTFFTKD